MKHFVHNYTDLCIFVPFEVFDIEKDLFFSTRNVFHCFRIFIPILRIRIKSINRSNKSLLQHLIVKKRIDTEKN